MLEFEVSPITPQKQNTDDRDSPALELHAIYITAVDWLERRMQCTENNYCYSVFKQSCVWTRLFLAKIWGWAPGTKFSIIFCSGGRTKILHYNQLTIE